MRENDTTETMRAVNSQSNESCPRPKRSRRLPPGEFWSRADVVEEMATTIETFELWVKMGLFVTYFGTDSLWVFTDDVMKLAKKWTPEMAEKAKSLRYRSPNAEKNAKRLKDKRARSRANKTPKET